MNSKIRQGEVQIMKNNRKRRNPLEEEDDQPFTKVEAPRKDAGSFRNQRRGRGGGDRSSFKQERRREYAPRGKPQTTGPAKWKPKERRSATPEEEKDHRSESSEERVEVMGPGLPDDQDLGMEVVRTPSETKSSNSSSDPSLSDDDPVELVPADLSQIPEPPPRELTAKEVGRQSDIFIRKIRNKIQFKQDQLLIINEIEEKVDKYFQGDTQLAYDQCQNQKQEIVSKEELDELKRKYLVEQSIDELTIVLNIYTKFHREEDLPSEVQPTTPALPAPTTAQEQPKQKPQKQFVPKILTKRKPEKKPEATTTTEPTDDKAADLTTENVPEQPGTEDKPHPPKPLKPAMVDSQTQCDTRSKKFSEEQMELVATLIATSMNQAQISQILSTTQISKGKRGAPGFSRQGQQAQLMTDLALSIRFFTCSYFGSFQPSIENQSTQQLKFQTFQEKVKHITSELKQLMEVEFGTGTIDNSIFKLPSQADPSQASPLVEKICYSQVRAALRNLAQNEMFSKFQLFPPSTQIQILMMPQSNWFGTTTGQPAAAFTQNEIPTPIQPQVQQQQQQMYNSMQYGGGLYSNNFMGYQQQPMQQQYQQMQPILQAAQYQSMQTMQQLQPISQLVPLLQQQQQMDSLEQDNEEDQEEESPLIQVDSSEEDDSEEDESDEVGSQNQDGNNVDNFEKATGDDPEELEVAKQPEQAEQTEEAEAEEAEVTSVASEESKDQQSSDEPSVSGQIKLEQPREVQAAQEISETVEDGALDVDAELSEEGSDGEESPQVTPGGGDNFDEVHPMGVGEGPSARNEHYGEEEQPLAEEEPLAYNSEEEEAPVYYGDLRKVKQSYQPEEAQEVNDSEQEAPATADNEGVEELSQYYSEGPSESDLHAQPEQAETATVVPQAKEEVKVTGEAEPEEEFYYEESDGEPESLIEQIKASVISEVKPDFKKQSQAKSGAGGKTSTRDNVQTSPAKSSVPPSSHTQDDKQSLKKESPLKTSPKKVSPQKASPKKESPAKNPPKKVEPKINSWDQSDSDDDYYSSSESTPSPEKPSLRKEEQKTSVYCDQKGSRPAFREKNSKGAAGMTFEDDDALVEDSPYGDSDDSDGEQAGLAFLQRQVEKNNKPGKLESEGQKSKKWKAVPQGTRGGSMNYYGSGGGYRGSRGGRGRGRGEPRYQPSEGTNSYTSQGSNYQNQFRPRGGSGSEFGGSRGGGRGYRGKPSAGSFYRNKGEHANAKIGGGTGSSFEHGD